MGDENNPEHAAKGLSGGQMVLLFLAGAAVCAIFFSAGFVVGYNEKSSKAAPVTEQVTDSPDIPPVITPERGRSATQPDRTPPKIDTPAADSDQPEPLRPSPLSASANQIPDAQPKSEVESRPASMVGPVRPSGGAGSFMIQVAATGTRPDGEKMVKTLRGMNYPAVLLTPEQAHAGDNLFRIQVGPFSTKDAAEKTKARLMQDGFKQPFIKH